MPTPADIRRAERSLRWLPERTADLIEKARRISREPVKDTPEAQADMLAACFGLLQVAALIAHPAAQRLKDEGATGPSGYDAEEVEAMLSAILETDDEALDVAELERLRERYMMESA